MSIKKALFRLLHPIKTFNKFLIRRLNKKVNLYSNETFLKKKFYLNLGYKLDLTNPITYNEKLQWLKLYYQKNELTSLADKYLVRNYVKTKIGEEYLIPLINVYDKPESIDFSVLPNQFVLKCNHNSGLGMCICKDKNNLDIDNVLKNLNKGLEEDYSLLNKEWPYKKIDRKIVCEKFMGDNFGKGINDYKFYCFNGEPKYFLVSTNRMVDVRFNYFDMQGKELPFSQGAKRGNVDLSNIDINKMAEIAKKLSEGLPHVRVDLYFINNHIYFGEMTFFDSSGFDRFSPKKWDYILGNYLVLPTDKYINGKKL